MKPDKMLLYLRPGIRFLMYVRLLWALLGHVLAVYFRMTGKHAADHDPWTPVTPAISKPRRLLGSARNDTSDMDTLLRVSEWFQFLGVCYCYPDEGVIL
jgi:hypothetical protein